MTKELDEIHNSFFTEIIQVNVLLERDFKKLKKDSDLFWNKIDSDEMFKNEFESYLKK